MNCGSVLSLQSLGQVRLEGRTPARSTTPPFATARSQQPSTGRPVRILTGLFLQRLGDDQLDLLIGHGRGPDGSGSSRQRFQPVRAGTGAATSTPCSGTRAARRRPKPIDAAVSAGQHDPRPLRQRLSRLSAAAPTPISNPTLTLVGAIRFGLGGLAEQVDDGLPDTGRGAEDEPELLCIYVGVADHGQ